MVGPPHDSWVACLTCSRRAGSRAASAHFAISPGSLSLRPVRPPWRDACGRTQVVSRSPRRSDCRRAPRWRRKCAPLHADLELACRRTRCHGTTQPRSRSPLSRRTGDARAMQPSRSVLSDQAPTFPGRGTWTICSARLLAQGARFLRINGAPTQAVRDHAAWCLTSPRRIRA